MTQVQDDYSFHNVWPKPDGESRKDVVEFWLAEGALPHGQAEERSSQLLTICREHRTSNVVGVSTVVPQFVDSLGEKCFFFRCYVGKSHRARGLLGSKIVKYLLRISFDTLNDAFQRGLCSDVVGLYLEIENSSVLRNRRQLVWNDLDSNIVYLGRLPCGGQRRAWYFDGAKLTTH